MDEAGSGAPMDDEAARIVDRVRHARALAPLLGRSPGFLAIVAQLPAAAQSDAPVLISGETGTGKELAARAIHYLSPRAALPFVAVNCGSLTDTVLEDALFGHERGAFTDARDRRPGLIEEAAGGTVLLDEVDQFSPRAQVMLLRVLQEGTFRRMGSSREQRVNVRFVAATNAPLAQRLADGSFRSDLYYRLCVFSIALPPLRERRDDIPALARHFLDKHADADRGPLALSARAVAALRAFDWPGNVRELENTMIRASRLCEGAIVEPEHLGLPAGSAPRTKGILEGPGTFNRLKKLAIEAFEREYLVTLMAAHGGNVTRAAAAAGKERRELGRLLKKHGLGATRSAPAPDGREP